jgi:hypothetical protein
MQEERMVGAKLPVNSAQVVMAAVRGPPLVTTGLTFNSKGAL